MIPGMRTTPIALSFLLAACGGGSETGGIGSPKSGVVYVSLVASNPSGTDGWYERRGENGHVSVIASAGLWLIPFLQRTNSMPMSARSIIAMPS